MTYTAGTSEIHKGSHAGGDRAGGDHSSVRGSRPNRCRRRRLTVTDVSQDLLAAVERKDGAGAGELLAHGADANAKDDAGRTALMHATLLGDVQMMETLIAAGADVDTAASLGETALMLAAISSKQTVPALIAHKADVNAQDREGKSVLMWAVDPQFHRQRSSSPEVIRALLAAGCDANARDKNGRTALMWALTGAPANELNPAALQALVDGGADVNGRNAKGMTPLMVFLERTEGVGPSADQAADIVKQLIDERADVNAADESGKTVLAYAKGKEKLRRLLTKAGAEK
jgi:ankyrin repeat protein